MRKYILTVTLNPAIDHTLIYSTINQYGQKQHISETYSSGGKGVNVARTLRSLRMPVCAIGIIGGKQHVFFTKGLDKEKIINDFLIVDREMRVNTTHILNNGKLIARQVKNGPRLFLKEINKFVKLYRNHLKKASAVALSGRKPYGIDTNIYVRLIQLAHQQKVPVLLDTHSEALRQSVKAKPDYIKPNCDEIKTLTRLPLNSQVDMRRALVSLQRRGLRAILLTMGKRGCVGLYQNQIFFVKPKPIKVINEVGCGDAFVGGFLYSLSKRYSFEQSVQFATATATANAMSNIAGYVSKKSVEKVLKTLTLKAL